MNAEPKSLSPIENPSNVEISPLVQQFLEKLDAEAVLYSHWKSNLKLVEALNGEGDLDLLVHPQHKAKFLTIVHSCGFRLAEDHDDSGNPFVFHFYGLDETSGDLIHLHIYFRLITGGALVKNHWLNLEEMLLQETRVVAQTRIPQVEAELILLVVRKMIEQPFFLEHYLYFRDRKNVLEELNWANELADKQKTEQLVSRYLPELDIDFFWSCNQALLEGKVLKKILLGRKMLKFFPINVMHPLRASFSRLTQYLAVFTKARLRIKKSNRSLFPGGAIVAFIGSEASGKSTISEEIHRWLKGNFRVKKVHFGKPPKSIYTRGPWMAIKLYASLKNLLGLSKAKTSSNGSPSAKVYEPHPLVACLDSIDRLQQAKSCVKLSCKGHIIISDRWPSQERNCVDGPRIASTSMFTSVLSKIEHRNYNLIPRPDTLIHVHAPLETTIQRNATRAEPEPENFVRVRYDLTLETIKHFKDVCKIDTSESLKESILKAKSFVWKAL